MRLIDADAKTFPTPYRINDTEHAKGWNSCLNSISQQPTIDAEPVRHGHWIEKDKYSFGVYRACSMCDNLILDTGHSWNYCPNCGAKMDEVSE